MGQFFSRILLQISGGSSNRRADLFAGKGGRRSLLAIVDSAHRKVATMTEGCAVAPYFISAHRFLQSHELEPPRRCLPSARVLGMTPATYLGPAFNSHVVSALSIPPCCDIGSEPHLPQRSSPTAPAASSCYYSRVPVHNVQLRKEKKRSHWQCQRTQARSRGGAAAVGQGLGLGHLQVGFSLRPLC